MKALLGKYREKAEGGFTAPTGNNKGDTSKKLRW